MVASELYFIHLQLFCNEMVDRLSADSFYLFLSFYSFIYLLCSFLFLYITASVISIDNIHTEHTMASAFIYKPWPLLHSQPIPQFVKSIIAKLLCCRRRTLSSTWSQNLWPVVHIQCICILKALLHFYEMHRLCDSLWVMYYHLFLQWYVKYVSLTLW